MKPLSSVKTECKNNPSDSPVREHSNPHCHRSNPHFSAQKNTEQYTAQPHRQAGNDHRKSNVTSCAHSISRDKRHGPDKRLYHCNPGHHIDTHLRALLFHVAQYSVRFGHGKFFFPIHLLIFVFLLFL